jgi:signal transduction histidine kinase
MNGSNCAGTTMNSNPVYFAPDSVDAHQFFDEPFRSPEAADRRTEFLAMVSHELRNPIGSILTAIELLRNTKGHLLRHDWVWAGVECAARQVRHLTDDLLCLYQSNQPTFELQLQRLNFAAVALAAVERRRPGFEHEGLRLVLHSSEKPIWVTADPVYLDLAFGNLLDNAAKYTDSAGIVVVSVEAACSDAVLRVQDTGVGIAPDALPFVFDAFMRERTDNGRPTRGSGIGLLLVRTLVELHGGRVDAFSAGRGRGSEFVIRLPTLESR